MSGKKLGGNSTIMAPPLLPMCLKPPKPPASSTPTTVPNLISDFSSWQIVSGTPALLHVRLQSPTTSTALPLSLRAYMSALVFIFEPKTRMESVVLLLLALLPFTSAAKTATTPTPILDVDGNAVQQGLQYHVVPADHPHGGIRLVKRSTPCPVNVIEDLSPAAAYGLPLNFTSVNPDETDIHTSTDVSVGFSVPSVCGKSPVWRLGGFDRSTGKWYVMTGGTIAGSLGNSTAGNRFKIKRYGKGYKFVFCPHVCRYCKVVCGDVGAVGGTNRKRLLGISSVPADFIFKKVTT